MRRRLEICCLVLLTACTAKRARAEFAKEHFCHDEDVSVTAGENLHFHLSGCGAEEDLDCRSQPCIKVRRAEKRVQETASQPTSPGVDLAPLDKARDGEIRGCYEQAWKKTPSLAGHLFVEFTIDKDGHVSNAKVARSTLHDQTLEACVAKRVGAVKFAPRSTPANMSVPFLVRP